MEPPCKKAKLFGSFAPETTDASSADEARVPEAYSGQRINTLTDQMNEETGDGGSIHNEDAIAGQMDEEADGSGSEDEDVSLILHDKGGAIEAVIGVNTQADERSDGGEFEDDGLEVIRSPGSVVGETMEQFLRRPKKFTDLPNELQDQIWKYATSSNRHCLTLGVTFFPRHLLGRRHRLHDSYLEKLGTFHTGLDKLLKMPPLLHATSHSRRVALRALETEPVRMAIVGRVDVFRIFDRLPQLELSQNLRYLEVDDSFLHAPSARSISYTCGNILTWFPNLIKLTTTSTVYDDADHQTILFHEYYVIRDEEDPDWVVRFPTPIQQWKAKLGCDWGPLGLDGAKTFWDHVNEGLFFRGDYEDEPEDMNHESCFSGYDGQQEIDDLDPAVMADWPSHIDPKAINYPGFTKSYSHPDISLCIQSSGLLYQAEENGDTSSFASTVYDGRMHKYALSRR